MSEKTKDKGDAVGADLSERRKLIAIVAAGVGGYNSIDSNAQLVDKAIDIVDRIIAKTAE